MAIEIDIAVACNYMQHYEWWSQVFSHIIQEVQAGDITIGKVYTSGTAVVDNAKNRLAGQGLHPKRETYTDNNRNKLAGVTVGGSKLPEGFMDSTAEWVFWLDDDTVQPARTIRKLLDLRREFVSGLYFLGGPPHNPLAYVRTEQGFYRPLYKYTYGVLTKVDAVGMGCALIHKGVYRKIMEAHTVFQQPDASLIAVPNKSITSYAESELDEKVRTNVQSVIRCEGDIGEYETFTMIKPLELPDKDDNRAWPFYAMAHSRTEDLYFGELCANAGVDIWVDTTITCDHWKTKAVNYQTYLDHQKAAQ